MNRKHVLPVIFLFLPSYSLAHCPLCTAGAGAAAALASTLGVGLEIIGVFIGAFGIATGQWTVKYVRKKLKKQYFSHQYPVIAWLIYLSVVLPVLPMMQDYTSIYISLAGGYGSLLNRTYLLNTYLIGSVIGGLITYTAPYISKKISRFRGDHIPFQGIALNFASLSVAALILHLVI